MSIRESSPEVRGTQVYCINDPGSSCAVFAKTYYLSVAFIIQLELLRLRILDLRTTEVKWDDPKQYLLYTRPWKANYGYEVHQRTSSLVRQEWSCAKSQEDITWSARGPPSEGIKNQRPKVPGENVVGDRHKKQCKTRVIDATHSGSGWQWIYEWAKYGANARL